VLACRVADGKLGLWAVLAGVLLRPRRFFESVKAGQVDVPPFWVYLVMLVLAAASTGVTVGRVADQSIYAMALIVAGTQLLVSPIGWFFEVRITHLAARMLKGQGALHETKAAVGFSSLPTSSRSCPMAVLRPCSGRWPSRSRRYAFCTR
jgi:hypothetical protein